MLNQPGLQLQATPADRWSAAAVPRLTSFASTWCQSYGLKELPQLAFEVMAPAQHVGLGFGTQLAMATATACAVLHQLPLASVAELAQRVGRARRSAVGSYGFSLGGVLLEHGHQSGCFPPLKYRIELPAAWRFLLARPRVRPGLSGPAEKQAFGQLKDQPGRPERLRRLAETTIIPAALHEQFEQFAEGVYEFGWEAGRAFESVQGGPYNGSAVADLVERIRQYGWRGVGQSSWGPTVFVVCQSQTSAEALQTRLSQDFGDELETQVAVPNRMGATLVIDDQQGRRHQMPLLAYDQWRTSHCQSWV